MKKDIHPPYHDVTIQWVDGSTTSTRSTYGKPGDVIELQNDPKSHPAWTGGSKKLVDAGGRLAKFNKRFAKKSDSSS